MKNEGNEEEKRYAYEGIQRRRYHPIYSVQNSLGEKREEDYESGRIPRFLVFERVVGGQDNGNALVLLEFFGCQKIIIGIAALMLFLEEGKEPP
jgi:hypothetical protein